MPIDIGLSDSDRAKIAGELSRLLADSYTLYLKTHNFHWNVTGPMFQTLHVMFEEHYNELFTAVDDIAERIRALGFKAPGSFKAFQDLATITEETGEPPAEDMISQLVSGHETVARTAREVFRLAADAGDEVTAGVATDRMNVHEKTAWMLRSLQG